MPNEHGPTTRHRRLAAELRRLREEAGLTPEVAAAALGWSRTKLVRIEIGRTMPSVADVSHILETYGGVSQAIKLALVQLARDIRQRGWWTSYGDVLAGGFVELEDAANHIRSWQVQLVPGLLQTERYARTVIGAEATDEAQIDRRLQARMTRRTLLARRNAPQLDVVLAEEVLRRPIGSRAIMADQLDALLAAAERPNVSIRVVPISIGHHPAIGQGSLVLFAFASPMDLDVAYVETFSGGVYVEDVPQVARCSVTFDRIADVALSMEESAAHIAAIAKEFRSQ
ncbi:helix-turn-helix domain-containing protein [Streptomyces halstedii]|uniref:helix-turn-helix domain-containing protein n=1 Tax=Streptomyces halstedii TaxID=1944 RepID=UPI00334F7DCD